MLQFEKTLREKINSQGYCWADLIEFCNVCYKFDTNPLPTLRRLTGCKVLFCFDSTYTCPQFYEFGYILVTMYPGKTVELEVFCPENEVYT